VPRTGSRADRDGPASPRVAVRSAQFSVRKLHHLFRYVGDSLEIVNLLEGHRDIEAFFGDQQP
jgi:hypothetical protein